MRWLSEKAFYSGFLSLWKMFRNTRKSLSKWWPEKINLITCSYPFVQVFYRKERERGGRERGKEREKERWKIFSFFVRPRAEELSPALNYAFWIFFTIQQLIDFSPSSSLSLSLFPSFFTTFLFSTLVLSLSLYHSVIGLFSIVVFGFTCSLVFLQSFVQICIFILLFCNDFSLSLSLFPLSHTLTSYSWRNSIENSEWKFYIIKLKFI